MYVDAVLRLCESIGKGAATRSPVGMELFSLMVVAIRGLGLGHGCLFFPGWGLALVAPSLRGVRSTVKDCGPRDTDKIH